MNLSARIGRMEGSTASQSRHIQIVAADEADAARQIEDAILDAGPGQITVEFMIDGRLLAKEMWNILSHEDNLERCNDEPSDPRKTDGGSARPRGAGAMRRGRQ